MTPDLLDQLRASYDVVPVVLRLSADTITPVSAFAALSDLAQDAFLLESVERGENVGRYSFIGVAPRRKLTFERGCENPIPLLREELVPLRVYDEDKLPPFFGGAVGFFGFGVASWSERLPDGHANDTNIPDATLLFIDQVICFDHVKQELVVIANIFTKDEHSAHDLLTNANEKLDVIVERLRTAKVDLVPLEGGLIARPQDRAAQASRSSGDTERGTGYKPALQSNLSRSQFEQMVCDAKEQILAGEIFQIVLSQRWTTDYPTDEALNLYRVLRTVNPSPYMFLLRTDSCTLVGSSPEMLVRLDDGIAETRPIAGTRPRGKTVEEDHRFEEELRADPKENAEHLMLVDLGRNDVGRVAASGSVRVTQYAGVERYSHVMHLVSIVEATLREDKRAIDLFLSAFPAGTLSGAPKIRALELIDQFEPTRRGPYGGAVAYFGFSGSLDSCIAIRTVVLKDDVAYIQAGAGIVYDSVPETEYEETINKSAALKRAIEIAKSRLARPVILSEAKDHLATVAQDDSSSPSAPQNHSARGVLS